MPTLVIYADVLVVLNLLIDGLLLRLCGLLAKTKPQTKWRLFLGALIGGLSSLLLLLPPLPEFSLFALRLLMATLMVWVAYGFVTWRRFLALCGWLLGTGLLFGGGVFALWYFWAPKGLVIHNQQIYFQVSLLQLLGVVCACYGLIWLICQMRAGATSPALGHQIIVCLGEKSITIPALLDTGNRLIDPFTGLPVLVCRPEALRPLLQEELYTLCMEKSPAEVLACGITKPPMHCMPYHTASGHGLMLVFLPDAIFISDGKKNRPAPDSVVGISPTLLAGRGEFQALLPGDWADQI